MITVKELYEQLDKLMKEDVRVGDLGIDACGVGGYLRVFRQDPHGPVTGLSLEDAGYMEPFIEHAEEVIAASGCSALSENEMQYLIELCEQEVSPDELIAFVKECDKSGSQAPSLEESKEKDNVQYFEICQSPSSTFHILAEWICIKGVREPTLEEAEAFLKASGDLDPKNHVVLVNPIDEVNAREDYNFENEETWPVFGVEVETEKTDIRSLLENASLIQYKGIVFDEWTVDADTGSVWAEMCQDCAEKYKDMLSAELSEGGIGACSVKGCDVVGMDADTEHHYYVDFDPSLIQVLEVREQEASVSNEKKPALESRIQSASDRAAVTQGSVFENKKDVSKAFSQ